MMLNFFDVFRFFTEIELTDEQRKYELIAVAIALVVVATVTVIMLIKNIKVKCQSEEKENDSYKKSAN